jgi:hypothetical protein
MTGTYIDEITGLETPLPTAAEIKAWEIEQIVREHANRLGILDQCATGLITHAELAASLRCMLHEAEEKWEAGWRFKPHRRAPKAPQ